MLTAIMCITNRRSLVCRICIASNREEPEIYIIGRIYIF